MQKVNCLNCGKELLRRHSKIHKTNFCSQKCLGEHRTGNKNGQWKGELVSYGALHDYIRWHLPKTDLCQCCGKVKPYDLANKGIYDRNFENWEWLCRKCHMTKDGRLTQLHQSNKDRKNKGEEK